MFKVFIFLLTSTFFSLTATAACLPLYQERMTSRYWLQKDPYKEMANLIVKASNPSQSKTFNKFFKSFHHSYTLEEVANFILQANQNGLLCPMINGTQTLLVADELIKNFDDLYWDIHFEQTIGSHSCLKGQEVLNDLSMELKKFIKILNPSQNLYLKNVHADLLLSWWGGLLPIERKEILSLHPECLKTILSQNDDVFDDLDLDLSSENLRTSMTSLLPIKEIELSRNMKQTFIHICQMDVHRHPLSIFPYLSQEEHLKGLNLNATLINGLENSGNYRLASGNELSQLKSLVQSKIERDHMFKYSKISSDLKSFSIRDELVIKSYTFLAFRSINKNLRNGHKTKKEEKLITALKKIPSKEHIVYRGASVLPGNISIDMLIEHSMKDPNFTISDPGFLSTSKNRNMVFGGQYKMKIHGITGKDVKPYSIYSSEDEVLFLPNTKLRYIGKIQEGNRVYYEFKEIGSYVSWREAFKASKFQNPQTFNTLLNSR